MRKVRIAMIKEPMLTMTRLQEILMNQGYFGIHGRALNREYLTRLVRKIKGAAEHGADRDTDLQRIAQMRERYNLIAERLFKIAFWDFNSLQELIPMPTVTEAIAAMKAIAELDMKLYDAEKIAGLFQQQGQEMIQGTWRARPMPDEFYVTITKAFKAHGFGPERLKEIQASALKATQAAQTNESHGNSQPTPVNPEDIRVVAG